MLWFDDIKKYFVFRASIKRFVWPILVIYMLDIGLSVSDVAVIAVCGHVVSLLLEIPSGMISDTLGHKKTLVLSLVGQALSMLLYLGGAFWLLIDDFADGSAVVTGFAPYAADTPAQFRRTSTVLPANPSSIDTATARLPGQPLPLLRC